MDSTLERADRAQRSRWAFFNRLLKTSAISTVRIQTVQCPADLRRFIRLPWNVYRGIPQWVPPLRSEVKRVLGPQNPFYLHAEKELFLAWKGGEVAGRIAAIFDHRYVSVHGEKAGFFGFFEAWNDPEVAEALMETAAEWLRTRGMQRVLGPMNPSANEECGLLIEGFDRPPSFMMPYNPPYYLDLMDRVGLEKIKELLAYRFSIAEIPDWLEKLAQKIARREPGFRVRVMNPREFTAELEHFKEIYNSAWEKNWGFVPMTDEEIDFMAQRIRPLIVPNLIFLATVNGRPAGLNLSLPDYNQVLIHLGGKLFPVGWLKFLWYRKKINRVRAMVLGVKAEFRKSGILALLLYESMKGGIGTRYREAEISWVLEENTGSRRVAEMVGSTIDKRYAIYGKSL